MDAMKKDFCTKKNIDTWLTSKQQIQKTQSHVWLQTLVNISIKQEK